MTVLENVTYQCKSEKNLWIQSCNTNDNRNAFFIIINLEKRCKFFNKIIPIDVLNYGVILKIFFL